MSGPLPAHLPTQAQADAMVAREEAYNLHAKQTLRAQALALAVQTGFDKDESSVLRRAQQFWKFVETGDSSSADIRELNGQ